MYAHEASFVCKVSNDSPGCPKSYKAYAHGLAMLMELFGMGFAQYGMQYDMYAWIFGKYDMFLNFGLYEMK